MKKSFILILMALCLVFVNCSRRVVIVPTDIEILRAESKQDDGTILALTVVKTAAVTDSSSALILLINNLDRAVKLDFDGNYHYTEKVSGDNTEKKITINTGSYKIAVSAPGLNFSPPQDWVNFEQFRSYIVRVSRVKEKVDYEK